MPRPRTHDDRTGRVFPDHLITCPKFVRVRWSRVAVLGFRKAPIQEESIRALISMGVSYYSSLASTLYNDVEQRPDLVKQGLTRAGIEKVRSVHACVLPPTYTRLAPSHHSTCPTGARAEGDRAPRGVDDPRRPDHRRVFPDHLITYLRCFGAPVRRVSPDHLITYGVNV